ncbi:MAG: DUF3617 domain-containing protein [Alphaproteobacteria bacterium]|nr:DUF3617 family protein [Alphaproteobacteria bacterium]MDE2110069.1 DUF3617 domain-containing protein [Alphaproteobacteria bacterium]MDE2493000.1 DUF3617 domain-containing protein [Alphaproteobacteria bacterium]
MKPAHLLLAAVGAAAFLPATAWASHVKPGLWEIKAQNNMAHAMPDMSQLPPQVQAQMRAHGVQMNGGGGMTIRRCITPAEAGADTPAVSQNKDCHVENVKATGRSYSADMVCTGRTTMHGHVQITFESPEHYYGTTTVTGMADGRPVNSATKLDAHWLAAACGAVK